MAFADRVFEGARELRPARVLANVVGALPYAIGMLAGYVVRGAWTLVAWIVTACRLGFSDTWARRRPRP